jgi:hypothetical protein
MNFTCVLQCGKVVDQIATEAFLRGCREKEAARSVLEKDPSSITQAVKMVKTYIANQRAIFGVRTSTILSPMSLVW